MTSANDLDWRLTVEFESKAHAHSVFSTMKTHASAALAASRLKEGLVVQHDAEWLRIYGDSYEALRRAQAIAASVIELEGVKAEEQAELRSAEGAEWERAELPPLPERDASLVSERQAAHSFSSRAKAQQSSSRTILRTVSASVRFCRLGDYRRQTISDTPSVSAS